MRDYGKVRPPLDAPALEQLALRYAGRFATSQAGLRRYLQRKIGERGWAGAEPADLVALSARFVAMGYVDDALLAEARGRSLMRRGLGRRRVAAALDALGIAGNDRTAPLAAAEEDGWTLALRFAERRRFGPFAGEVPDEAGRRRATGAMLRAGHAPEHVRKILNMRPGCVPEQDGN